MKKLLPFIDTSVFKPKLFTTLKTYTKQDFVKDLIAGIIVGIVALPMAIAFGIASGVTPEQGIITAIIAGFIISFLGGSRVQIGGPTGAFIVIVAGIVAEYGITGLLVATLLAGVMLIIMGLLKLGDVIKFIPYPIIVGFTSGIALTIFSTQMKDFFGLDIATVPSAFHEKWICYFQNFSSINYWATGIAVFTVLVSFLWNKINKVIPGTLIAIIITTAAVAVFDLPVETIGSKFGDIRASIPAPSLPDLNFKMLTDLIPVAFTIAMLGAIESLLSAMVADGAIGGNHRANTELIAQGIANIITPLFGGIPATGAIARTMTNIKNGGRTPVAGIIHALVLLLILLVFGKLAKMIPLSCLAGILVVIAYNMSEWRSFVGLFKNSRSEVAVLLTTFLLTVIFDLTIAIEIGLILALFLFVRRITKTTKVEIFDNQVATAEEDKYNNSSIPDSVDIFRINGPFFFGVANKFEETSKRVRKAPLVRIIDMYNVPFMDATGLRNFNSFVQKCHSSQMQIILSRVSPEVLDNIKKDPIYEAIGKENIFSNIEEAVQKSKELVNNSENK